MANHKSAEKRARQSEKRREHNMIVRSATRTSVKKALEIIASATTREQALAALAQGERALQKAASKGVLPKERASRKTARLASAVKRKFSAPSSSARTSA